MEITNHHRALIALMQVPNFGPPTVRKLIRNANVEDPIEIFDLPLPVLEKIDGMGKVRAKNIVEFDEWDAVDKVIKRTEEIGAKIVGIQDPEYPELLKHIYDPPILFWLLGNPDVLNEPGIAVVGTRNPGRYGLDQAKNWCQKLVENRICINSGLAYGIDSAAHQTAVKNSGKTIAVLGSGIDWIYPNKNRKLAAKIIETGGAIITEFPPGSKPDAVNFPERNRIVSGMSHGVLVVESGVKGGSMITARSALDQNREVFVIPHPLNYMKGEGCNYLIRTGQGKLVQSIEDILSEVSIETERSAESTKGEVQKEWREMELDEESAQICELLERNKLHIDQLNEEVEKPTYKLMSVLLDLEMKGAIRQKAGKYFELC
ncbi:MAG: DNA-processing protein DprA [Balneolaceae bacterium]